MPLMTAGHRLFTIQQVAAGHKLLTFSDSTRLYDIHRFSNGDWLIHLTASFIRMTPDGVIVWAKDYTVGVVQVVMDSDDTFYGVTNRVSTTPAEFRLFKYASDGSVIWGSSIRAQYVNQQAFIYLHETYVYVCCDPGNVAGHRTDKATGISVGSVTVFSTIPPVVVGDSVYSMAVYNRSSDYNCAFLKYAATGGTPALSKKLRTSSTTVQMHVKRLRVDPSGTYGYYIAGQLNSSGVATKMALDTGNSIARVQKNSSSYSDYYDDAVASDGSYFMLVKNTASSVIHTVKCDANLNPLWKVRISVGGAYCDRIWALGDKLVHGVLNAPKLLISDMSYNGALFNRNSVLAEAEAATTYVGGPTSGVLGNSPALTVPVYAGTRSAYANTVSDSAKTASVITV